MSRRPFNAFARLQEGVYRFSRGGSASAGASAADAGPHVTLVGGVHGNERIGVEVLDALRLALLRAAPLSAAGGLYPLVTRGSVTLVYGNPRAIRIGTRGSEPHADLNRCFPRDLLTNSDATGAGSFEQRRAKALAPLFSSSDLLVDLHSTNKPSPPFVRLSGHAQIPPKLWEVSARLPTRTLLHDPRHLIGDGHVALTDEFVGVHGGMGICYESGVASDLSRAKVDAITRSLLQMLQLDTQSMALMDASGRISESDTVVASQAGSKSSPRDVYEITEVFKLTERGFRWADGVGDENFQRVERGQPIGFIGSGNDEPFMVNYDAHIVFPKIPSLWKLGAPLGWLTRRVAK